MRSLGVQQEHQERGLHSFPPQFCFWSILLSVLSEFMNKTVAPTCLHSAVIPAPTIASSAYNLPLIVQGKGDEVGGISHVGLWDDSGWNDGSFSISRISWTFVTHDRPWEVPRSDPLFLIYTVQRWRWRLESCFQSHWFGHDLMVLNSCYFISSTLMSPSKRQNKPTEN